LVEGEIVKVTTKGQITLPARIRRSLNIRDDSHLYVAQTGDLVVMKRVDELTLSDITGIFERLAAEKGVTGEILGVEVEEQRKRTVAEKGHEA
jgi:AbrB family looped-hinge helix DNA binding protein